MSRHLKRDLPLLHNPSNDAYFVNSTQMLQPLQTILHKSSHYTLLYAWFLTPTNYLPTTHFSMHGSLLRPTIFPLHTSLCMVPYSDQLSSHYTLLYAWFLTPTNYLHCYNSPHPFVFTHKSLLSLFRLDYCFQATQTHVYKAVVMRMLGWMSGVTELDRIRNERIRGTTEMGEISKKVG